MMIVSSLQFDCSRGVALMEFFILKLSKVTIRSFKIYPATDKAARCVCAAILKNSSLNETDPAECQLFTTATILENGPQFAPFRPPKISINGFFESIEDIWNRIWGSACAAMAFCIRRTLRQQHNARKRRSIYQEHMHGHSGRDADYYHHLLHVHKDK
ncbi:hypothetical protein NC651_008829, partial [Populus alba x Populus x berolinensis]